MDQAEQVLACVDELIGLHDPAHLPIALAGPLHELIPYDYLVYNEIDTANGAIITVSEPAGVESKNAAFEAYADQHPLLRHYQTTRDPSVLRLSDHIGRTEFHRLELYNEFLRFFGIEHQIVCTVPAVRTVAIGLVLTRKQRDFSTEESDLLAALRPHVVRAYRAARDHAEIERRLAAIDDALGARHQAVIVLDADGAPVTASPHAQSLLAAFDGGSAESLVRQLGPIGTLKISRAGGNLVVTRTSAALLLDEETDPLPLSQLSGHGLSARECDVFHLVADGLSNKAIAERLGISLRTVKKHLERIYDKLDVSSRTAAVARVRDSLGA